MPRPKDWTERVAGPKNGKTDLVFVVWGAKTSENQVRLESYVQILETAVNNRPLGRSQQPHSHE